MCNAIHSERRCEMVVSGQKQDWAALFLVKDPFTHRIPGSVNPGVYRRFGEEKKKLAPAVFDIKTVLSVAE